MASGGSRIKTGSFYGTGSDMNIDTVGFRPKRIHILNETDVSQAWWNNEMADDAAIKQVTAGTISVITSNGITPRAAGFSLGADSDLNAAADLIYYTASD